MLPLAGRAVPADRQSFTEALRAGFKALGLEPRAVEATGDDWPCLAHLTLDLTGAEASRALRPPGGMEKTGEKMTIGQFSLLAQPLLIEKTPLQIDARFSAAEAEFMRDREGALFLSLLSAGSGELDVTIAHSDLERALHSAAAEAAAKHGAEVKSATLELETPTPRSLVFRAAVTAKVFIMKTTVRVRGRVDLDETLSARIFGLAAEGEGMLASIVESGLRPHLAKVEGEKFALGGLVAGGLRVSDVSISAGPLIQLHASFADAAG